MKRTRREHEHEHRREKRQMRRPMAAPAHGQKRGLASVKNGLLFEARARLRAPHAWVLIALGAVVIMGMFTWMNRPQPNWHVTAELVEVWQQMIMQNDSAPRWAVVEVAGHNAAEALPSDGFGFQIGMRSPDDETLETAVHLHHNLARWGNPNDGFVVAVDPWLVFRRHSTPPLLRERVEEVASPAVTASSSRSWPGTLILPGADTAALQAWTAQLLQEAPGRFETNPEEWEVVRSRLTRSGRFQRGALTYDWEDVWPRLLGTEQVWLYAPLSRVQELPGDRTSALEADVFPIPESWNEYGLQARLLWATPINIVSWLHRTRIDRELAAAREWLQSPETQSQIASALKWTPAHRLSRAATPLSATAHRFWIGSSFIWEDISHNGELGNELVGKKGETIE